MTLIGLLTNLILLLAKLKPTKYYTSTYTILGERWGGLTLGNSILISKSSGSSILLHELGHTYQNAIFGPLFIFLVAIPSAIRYHLRNKFKKLRKKSYDSIWFERSATHIGLYYESVKGEKK